MTRVSKREQIRRLKDEVKAKDQLIVHLAEKLKKATVPVPEQIRIRDSFIRSLTRKLKRSKASNTRLEEKLKNVSKQKVRVEYRYGGGSIDRRSL